MLSLKSLTGREALFPLLAVRNLYYNEQIEECRLPDYSAQRICKPRLPSTGLLVRVVEFITTGSDIQPDESPSSDKRRK